jgi:hypothetical protein
VEADLGLLGIIFQRHPATRHLLPRPLNEGLVRGWTFRGLLLGISVDSTFYLARIDKPAFGPIKCRWMFIHALVDLHELVLF